MDANLTQNHYGASDAGQMYWDLDKMVDQVRLALNEEVDILTIRLKLIDILSNYQDVPVRTFVPIFASKEAIKALRK